MLFYNYNQELHESYVKANYR